MPNQIEVNFKNAFIVDNSYSKCQIRAESTDIIRTKKC
jgi:hypothetical protein